jgi:hypothetical protein
MLCRSVGDGERHCRIFPVWRSQNVRLELTLGDGDSYGEFTLAR